MACALQKTGAHDLLASCFSRDLIKTTESMPVISDRGHNTGKCFHGGGKREEVEYRMTRQSRHEQEQKVTLHSRLQGHMEKEEVLLEPRIPGYLADAGVISGMSGRS